MGRPKALLPWTGKAGAGTFLSVLAETLGIYCSPVCAVFGFDAPRLMSCAPPSVMAVDNPDYRRGMMTSLQAGLRAVTNGNRDMPERILFTLVDHPSIAAETVRRLLELDALVAIPRYAGERGHPVVLRHEIAREILAAPATSRLDHVLDHHADKIRYIDVDDPAVREDIDDPVSYAELLARPPRAETPRSDDKHRKDAPQ